MQKKILRVFSDGSVFVFLYRLPAKIYGSEFGIRFEPAQALEAAHLEPIPSFDKQNWRAKGRSLLAAAAKASLSHGCHWSVSKGTPQRFWWFNWKKTYQMGGVPI